MSFPLSSATGMGGPECGIVLLTSKTTVTVGNVHPVLKAGNPQNSWQLSEAVSEVIVGFPKVKQIIRRKQNPCYSDFQQQCSNTERLQQNYQSREAIRLNNRIPYVVVLTSTDRWQA
jgi:hypothetical protein